MSKNDFESELADIPAKDLFWKKCALDEDHRSEIIFGYVAITALFILCATLGTCTVLTSLDDVDEAKQVTALCQAKQDAVKKYIDQGVNPAVARCMVAEGSEIYNLSCSSILKDGLSSPTPKNPAGNRRPRPLFLVEMNKHP